MWCGVAWSGIAFSFYSFNPFPSASAIQWFRVNFLQGPSVRLDDSKKQAERPNERSSERASERASEQASYGAGERGTKKTAGDRRRFEVQGQCIGWKKIRAGVDLRRGLCHCCSKYWMKRSGVPLSFGHFTEDIFLHNKSLCKMSSGFIKRGSFLLRCPASILRLTLTSITFCSTRSTRESGREDDISVFAATFAGRGRPPHDRPADSAE